MLTHTLRSMQLTLPDSTVLEVAPGQTFADALASVKTRSPVVAVRSGGRAYDLSAPAEQDMDVDLIELSSPAGLDIYRHSTSHIMAEAVKSLYPDAQVTIGPSIEDGFYYDFDYSRPFTPADVDSIEARMRELIEENRPFERITLDRDAALQFFTEQNERYKVELIGELPYATVSLYRHGGFTDLCRGPHLPSSGMIKAFKLTGIAGAYWRGNEKNKMLQRIYGTAFPDARQLKAHLQRIEEAKKRDHRKLGRELDLFNIYDEAGAGLIVYHPKGALVRRILEDFEVKQHLQRGYQLVKGPQILKLDVWEKSGHLDHYRENMYFTEVDGKQYGLKPMNCIAHMLIYKSSLRSYKDLPLRYFELGTVNRHEKSGVLHGLSRVREFTQDDAHILCAPNQLVQEINAIIEFVAYVMRIFDFTFAVELSTRPGKSIGSDADWERATRALQQALESGAIAYSINEGDGAFYGPKIDFKLNDCLGRAWQCATIQCDFSLPERFDLTYIGEDGEKHRPVMLHRVILGSIERFLGILIEHYAGAFPVWLAPVQARIMTITDAQHTYAQGLHERLVREDLRAELDLRNESLGLKIREAQLQKIPYMLVIGNKEMESGGVSPRLLSGQNLGCMPVDTFLETIRATCRKELHAA